MFVLNIFVWQTFTCGVAKFLLLVCVCFFFCFCFWPTTSGSLSAAEVPQVGLFNLAGLGWASSEFYLSRRGFPLGSQRCHKQMIYEKSLLHCMQITRANQCTASCGLSRTNGELFANRLLATSIDHFPRSFSKNMCILLR